MNYLWQMTIDDYLEIIELARVHGKKPGDSMEEELNEYMQARGKKSIGATELTQDELLKEHASHGKKVLSIETDKNGKQKYKIIKKKLDN